MGPKTRAEIQRAYRKRKKQHEGVTKKPRKTRSEIQRAYRERKKLKNKEDFLEKERDRKRKSYIPTSLLTEPEQAKRRKASREKSMLFRERLRRNKENLQTPSTAGSEKNIDDENSQRLVVKLDFKKGKKTSSRKRISRGVARANKKIKSLQETTLKLQRKTWSLQKKLQRKSKEKKKPAATATEPEKSPKTPRSKCNSDLRKAGMSPRTVPRQIRKQLVLAHAVSEEVKKAVQSGDSQKSNTRRGLTASIISGRIIKRYQCLRTLSKMTGIGRELLAKANKKLSYPKKKRLPEKSQEVTEKIIAFLERSDNSRMMPGKADFVNYNGTKVQKRYLNDYMYNLHAKFRAEYPNVTIGKTAFCQRRPKYIIHTSFSSRRTCLCQHHQNLSLKLRAIKSLGVTAVSVNPDKFIEDCKDEVAVNEVVDKLPTVVQFSQWKRVEVDGKKKMKILAFNLEKEKFRDMLKKEVEQFRGHARRVRVQYEQLKSLKENLEVNEAIVQMDFAENYSCQSVEEVQSAYWNASVVTLHPAVAYYRSEDGAEVTHKSMVFVSDEMGHNSSTVFAFLKELIPHLKVILPNIKHIHYYTNSRTSQYRNKTIFYLLSRHKDLFDVSASWNYFEAGHGKGPCDGVGGSVKRMADEAVRQQKVSIQDASDFFSWTQQHQSASSVSFTFVSKEACRTAQSEIERFGEITPVQGTMTVHAVAAISPGKIIARETSCYCEQCFANGTYNPESPCRWKIHLLKECSDTAVTPVAGDWVAAVYDRKWYVGKVLEADHIESDALITFMQSTTKQVGFLKWPTPADQVWIDFKSILATIEPPFPSGKTKRQYKLHDETVAMIEGLFAKQQANKELN